MYRKDYINRQFEEFGRFLAKILRAKNAGDWQQFESEIGSALKTFTPYELEEVETMNISDFIADVLNNDNLTSEQVKILARLMYERLEQFMLAENRDMISLQAEKCRFLYEKARQDLTENEFDLDIHYKIDFLSKLLLP